MSLQSIAMNDTIVNYNCLSIDNNIEVNNFVDKNISEKTVSTNFFVYFLHQYWIEEGDPRVNNYLMFNGGPELFFAIMFSWLLFVLKLGPYLMKDRKPFVLREVMMAYNLALVLININAIHRSIKWLDFGRKALQLKLPDRNDYSQQTLLEINEKVFYFYTKMFDLLDTVFFVLRKKSHQITFLHVYHHFIVPVLAWITYKLCIQSCVFGVFGALNSSVHVVMYSYYFLAAFGPQMQKYLWWKRYITSFQLIQFAVFIVYAVYCFTCTDLSDYPDAIKYIVMCQPFIFFYLFFKFYLETYRKKSKSIKTN